MQNRLFQTLPQERVVKGLPVFSLVNDAIQINRAFRSKDDSVLICVLHIPFKHIENNTFKVISNNAIDFKYNSKKKDICINPFIKNNFFSYIDYKSLRIRGVDLYESYLKGLPFKFKKITSMGISQEFYFLKIKKIKNSNKIYDLYKDDFFLKNNEFFMHGFFGDQNILGRDVSTYVPYKCYKVVKNV